MPNTVEGLSQVNTQAVIGSTLDLVQYFDKLSTAINTVLPPIPNRQPPLLAAPAISFKLSSHNNDIFLQYDVDSETWACKDKYGYLIKSGLTTTQLVDEIKKSEGFLCDVPEDCCCFAMAMYAETGDHFTQLKNSIDEFKQQHPINIELAKTLDANLLPVVVTDPGAIKLLLADHAAFTAIKSLSYQDISSLVELAIEKGQTAVIAELLKTEQGQELLALNYFAKTPAFLAVEQGQAAVIAEFLRSTQGQRLLAIESMGRTPAYLAAQLEQFGVMTEFLNTSEGRSLLLQAAAQAHIRNDLVTADIIDKFITRNEIRPVEAHQAVIDLGIELGYANYVGTDGVNDISSMRSAYEKGLCNGLAVSWMKSCLVNDQRTFNERIDFIGKNPAHDITNRIETLRAKAAEYNQSREKGTSAYQYTDEERELLEIPALYESISLHQSPSQFSTIFSDCLNQDDVEAISSISQSQSQENSMQEIHKLSTPQAIIGSSSDIIKYFTELASSIKTVLPPGPNSPTPLAAPPICFNLASHNHAISLQYNVDNETWTYMDINRWPPKLNLTAEQLVMEVNKSAGFMCFNPPGCILFQLTPYTLAGEHFAQLKNCVTEFTQQHPINIELATQVGSNLLKVIVHSPEAIKQLSADHEGLTAISGQSDQGLTLAYIAVEQNRNDVIAELLQTEQGRGLLATEFQGMTSAYIAMRLGQVAVIAEFLRTDQGLDLLKTECSGYSPTFIATYQGQAAVIAELLQTEQGRGLLATECQGKTSAYLAAELGHAAVIGEFLKTAEGLELLKGECSGFSPAYIAAHKGQAVVIAEFLQTEQGRGLLATECQGKTSAFLAAEQGHTAVIAEFLKTEQGIELLKAKCYGISPAHIAIKQCHAGVIAEYLRTEQGRELLATEYQGKTSAYLAAELNQKVVIAEFLRTEQGRGLLATECNGKTSAYIAAELENYAVMAEFFKVPEGRALLLQAATMAVQRNDKSTLATIAETPEGRALLNISDPTIQSEEAIFEAFSQVGKSDFTASTQDNGEPKILSQKEKFIEAKKLILSIKSENIENKESPNYGNNEVRPGF